MDNFFLGLNIHNTIATSFLDIMQENTTNRDLIRLLTKEALLLEVSDDQTLRTDLTSGLDKLLEVKLIFYKIKCIHYR